VTLVRIIYDDPLIRELLRIFVASDDAFYYREPHEIGRGLILLDAARVYMIPELRRDSPGSKIIAVTNQPEYSYLNSAHEFGADSFWYIAADGESLLSVMNQTLGGASVYPETTPLCPLGSTDSSRLTKREMDVLKALAAGDTDAQIAENLFISVRTVKTHIQNMREKTGFRNRTELAVQARASGLVIPETEVLPPEK